MYNEMLALASHGQFLLHFPSFCISGKDTMIFFLNFLGLVADYLHNLECVSACAIVSVYLSFLFFTYTLVFLLVNHLYFSIDTGSCALYPGDI